MRLLFSPAVEAGDIPAIPGLSYLPDYVSQAEQAQLVEAMDSRPWDTRWDRRRQPYGVEYGRGDGNPPPIPDWGMALAERMYREGISERPFDHLLVNEYLPGQGIAFHGDYAPFDRTVVSLSLLSPCVMDFRQADTGRRESLLLEPRSLLILSDEARYEWQHGIARRKTDRWKGMPLIRERRLSVTFRLLRRDGSEHRVDHQPANGDERQNQTDPPGGDLRPLVPPDEP
jgi:alkylated DNA repair dioxygenase AlkB